MVAIVTWWTDALMFARTEDTTTGIAVGAGVSVGVAADVLTGVSVEINSDTVVLAAA